MRLKSAIFAVVCVLGAPRLFAAELVVRVSDTRGRPAADAVVSVSPRQASSAAATARANSTAKIIDQKDETFIPYVEVFRPGDQVVFRNSDTTRHHVYSFSPTKSFELVLRPGESSPEMPLDKAGVVAVGCNIHDRMITYLYVTDATLAVRTGPDGVARLGDIQPGGYSVRAWHPQLRPGQDAKATVRSVAVEAGGETGLEFKLQVLPDPRRQVDRERAAY